MFRHSNKRIQLAETIFWTITKQIQEKEAKKDTDYKGASNELFFIIFFHQQNYMQ